VAFVRQTQMGAGAPTKSELIVNLETTKRSLSPCRPSLLGRADKVIE
jgi:hypothetical protein